MIAMAQPKADYDTGVWYIEYTGEFCRVVEQDNTFGLYQPDESAESPYFTYDQAGLTKDEAVEQMNEHFVKIDSNAHENPVEHVKRLHERATETELTQQEELELRYCFEYEVELTEK